MYVRGDRIMAGICCVLCVISACFAPAYGTWGLCVFGAAPLAGLAVALAWKFAGRLFTRLVIAFIFMSFAALYIDQFRGLIEMHFSVFVLLAFLLFYRDWRPVALAAGVIAVQHYGFCMLQMRGLPLYVFPMDHGCSMVLVHAAFVIFESACLIYLGAVTRKEAIESAIITALGELMARDGVVDLGMMHGAGRSRGLQQFLQAIRSTVEGAGMAADRIGSVSLEITGSAKRMFEAGSTQNSATSEVVTTLHRMAEATGSIAIDCNEVARVVTTSKDILHSGRNTMAQTVTLMETLELSVADVSRQINDLHGDSARIETIIRSISDIADQTTLLAFNATIEATRAGELGSGFNVVAREVRDLSTRTLASLSEAQQVVEQVRSRTASAKLASDRCRQDATRGGAQVGQAHLALAGVAERLPDIAARTADVLRVAERHGQLAGKIMERLDDIGAAVGTNSEDLSRFDELSRGLHEMARELCTSVSQFRAA